jgi:hypothetical protein
MPSPRPSGSGAWKILLFPQCLHDGIFHFIVFIGYIFKPIICFLLWVSVVRYHSCDLFIFISLCLTPLTCALVWLPLSLLGGLSTVSDHMSWFLATVTDDFSFISLLSFPLVILCTWFCLFFSACKPGPCTSWGCVHGIWIPMGWCNSSPLLWWFWSHCVKIVDPILQVDVSFLCFERLIVPLLVRLRIFVCVDEVVHFAR